MARRCQFRLASWTTKQVDAEHGFKLADLPADGAVGDAELFSRDGQSAKPGGGLERAQCVERYVLAFHYVSITHNNGADLSIVEAD